MTADSSSRSAAAAEPATMITVAPTGAELDKAAVAPLPVTLEELFVALGRD